MLRGLGEKYKSAMEAEKERLVKKKKKHEKTNHKRNRIYWTGN